MLSLPLGPNESEMTIQLTDPEFEDARTIRTCLTIIAKYELDFDLKKDGDINWVPVWRTRLST